MAEKKSNNGPGRGWHGDSAGHAKAGRLGGKSKSKSEETMNLPLSSTIDTSLFKRFLM